MFNFTENEMINKLEAYFNKNKIYDNPEMTNVHYYYLYNKLSFEVNNPLSIVDCPVNVRKSTIDNGGNGLFSTQDIKKGSIFCIYPAHGILYTSNSYGITLEEHKEKYDDIFGTGDYCFSISSEPIQIYASPTIQNNNWLKGHIANDKGLKYFNELEEIKGSKCPHQISRFLLSYLVNERNNNTVIKTIEVGGIKLLTLKAKRDIKKDEEIFLPYFPSYWLGKNDIKYSNKELTNMLLFNLMNKPLSVKKYYYNLMKNLFNIKL